MPVTYPHFGSLSLLFKSVFHELKVPLENIVEPIPINKQIIENGSRHSPEWMCTPFKFCLGSLLESIERGADHVFQIGGIGTCRASCYGPVQRVICKDLGYDVKFTNIDYHLPFDMLRDFKEISNGFNTIQTINALCKIWVKNYSLDLIENLINFYRAIELESGQTEKIAKETFDILFELRKIREIKRFHKTIPSIFKSKIGIDQSINPLKVGVIGEIYALLEPTMNLDLYRRLNELGVATRCGVSLKKFTDVPAKFNPFKKEYYKVYRKEARPYMQEYIGGDGQESVGTTIFLKKKGWDGMVHVWPFSCIPELAAQNVLPAISEKFDMPVLPMVVDEQTGEAGYQTRLEAFVDMLRLKREESLEGREPEKITWETFNYD